MKSCPTRLRACFIAIHCLVKPRMYQCRCKQTDIKSQVSGHTSTTATVRVSTTTIRHISCENLNRNTLVVVKHAFHHALPNLHHLHTSLSRHLAQHVGKHETNATTDV